jgi:hypothetical protein
MKPGHRAELFVARDHAAFTATTTGDRKGCPAGCTEEYRITPAIQSILARNRHTLPSLAILLQLHEKPLKYREKSTNRV